MGGDRESKGDREVYLNVLKLAGVREVGFLVRYYM